MPEVITFGEAMIRLAPPDFQRLEQARQLTVEVGGAELNTAVGLARLGRQAAWVSRLTDNPLGRLIVNRGREAGVVTDRVLLTPDDRVGVYYLEFGAAPRASSVLYDRAASAMARIAPGMIDWAGVFAGARWFHVTGITAALSTTAAAATLEALDAARTAGLTTSLDPNYRSKLWSVTKAADWYTQAAPLCDVVFSSAEDVERFFGVPAGDVESQLRTFVERYHLRAAAFTRRETPLVWRNTWSALACAGRTVVRSRDYEVEIVDRLGAGDAFAAGFIHGLLDGDIQKAVDCGTAAGALKHSIPGDFPWFTRDELDAVMAGAGARISR